MSLSDPFRRKPAVLAGLPRIVRMYIAHCLIGFGLAGIFTGLIIGFNVVGIGHLVASVSGGWLAAFVFFMLNGIVFAGVQTSIAVMGLQDDDDPSGGGGKSVRVTPAVPRAVAIPVAQDAPRRHG